MLHEHPFESIAALQEALYSYCCDALAEDLQHCEQVSCLLSGGGSPLPLYRALASAPLPWQRITPALVDERWVPVDDPASNEGSIRECFADNSDFQQALIGMYSAGTTALAAEALCNRRYASLPRPASFCLLGLGADGHTASLFPAAEGLKIAMVSENNCKALMARPSPVTGAHTERMSLTLSGILNSRRIVLLFCGADKLQLYRRALGTADPYSLPIAAVLQQAAVPIHVFHCP